MAKKTFSVNIVGMNFDEDFDEDKENDFARVLSLIISSELQHRGHDVIVNVSEEVVKELDDFPEWRIM